MSSAQRRKLADISNFEGQAEQMNREETQQQQQQNMLFSSKEYAEKLQKALSFQFDCENMTLMKALAHRNKIIEVSGVEFQKLRINLRNVQEKNLQLAQANSQMLAELNTNRDRLKLLQHELVCKNVLLEAKKMRTEASYFIVLYVYADCFPSNVSDGHCQPFQAHDMNLKDNKRKRTSRIKPSESSIAKPIHVDENANSKRRVSGVIGTTVIPEVTCQTEDDTEKGGFSQGANQIADTIVNKKFVLDAANPVKDSVQSKRQCVRRKSTRFDVQETEQTDTVLEMDDANGTKETASRICLKRRSARLRPEEAEPCKSFHERDDLKEAIKGRRVSSKQQPSRFDFQEPEATGTLNAADAGRVSGVRNTTVTPEVTCVRLKMTLKKRLSLKGQTKLLTILSIRKLFLMQLTRQCVGRKSTRFDVQVAEQTETVLGMEDAKETKETASRLSLRRGSARLRPKEAEPCKNFHERDEVKETIKSRRVSSKQQSATFDFQEPEVTETLSAVDARVTARRQSTKGKSKTGSETSGAIKECDLLSSTVSQEDIKRESKNKPKLEETGGMMRRTSMRRTSRHAAEKVQSYREVSLKVKLRRDC
ncbi:unnamed protein product [Eruca vesicaria subsp. sativa]|uniref:Shugoshin C-terminal domain-containing protein n=1 Tax=Eruca vesicaria subsp. sativa TaxID=29727 RepID=A0ABC8LAA0_ERUVS|nr:unnamed protein product [Eruca vesicaria subsp. sativa]